MPRIQTVWVVALTCTATLSCLTSPPGFGQDRQGAGNKTPIPTNKPTTASVDYKKLVESLKNGNAPPKILGDTPDEDALFPKTYKWAEQDRILRAVQRLLDDVDRDWLVLAEFLDDKAYCLTFRHDQSVSNYSVGDVCDLLLTESLTAAYMPHIPKGRQAFRRLRNPDAVDVDNLAKWCREQHEQKRPFYELQIEMCEWAMKKMSSLDEPSEDEKRDASARIQEQVDNMRRTRQAVTLKSVLRADFRSVYSEKAAARIRDRYEKK